MKLRNLFLYKYSPKESFTVKDAVPSKKYPAQKNEGGPELSGSFRKDFKKLKDEFAFGTSGDIKMREFTIQINEKDHNEYGLNFEQAIKYLINNL